MYINQFCIIGHDNKSDDFQSFLYKAYPKLASCGGFELLKISGTTRSKDLGVIECPNEGYTIQHLISPEASVGQAIIYIRPLQLDIDSALMASRYFFLKSISTMSLHND